MTPCRDKAVLLEVMQTHGAAYKPYTRRSRGPSRRFQSLILGTALVMSASKSFLQNATGSYLLGV